MTAAIGIWVAGCAVALYFNYAASVVSSKRVGD